MKFPSFEKNNAKSPGTSATKVTGSNLDSTPGTGSNTKNIMFEFENIDQS